MTTTLTLTPDATTASVLITATTNAEGLTLTRTDQNGVAPVRLLAGQELEQAVAVRDHEPALVGPVRYTCTTTEPVELRRNHATSPRPLTTLPDGFGFAAGRWFGNGGAGAYSVVSGASDAPSGLTEYMRKTWTIAPNGFGASGDTGYQIRNFTTLEAGRTYIASAWIRASVARSIYWRLTARVNGNQGAPATDLWGPVQLIPAGEWVRVSRVFTMPAGQPQLVGILDSNTAFNGTAQNWQAGSTLDVAGLLVERGDELRSYFDGSFPSAQWTGAANASPSVIRGIETAERIVRFDEGAHEVATDVWSVVERPQYSARGRLTLAQSLTAGDRSSRHDIIGRPDPIFTMQRGGFRTGTVEVLCADVAQVEAFYQLQAQAGIVQVRTAALSPGQRLLSDLYVKVTGVTSATEQGTVPWKFRLRLDIAEVRRPTGPLLGAAVWTYAALPMPELGLTYEGLPRLFATYNDLAAGVRIDA